MENADAHQGFRMMFEMERKVPYKEDCHIVGTILTGMVVLFAIFFFVDFWYEWGHEIDRKMIEVKQCNDDFLANK